MRISTKGQNAIKLMLDLATYSEGDPVRLKDIAKRQRISEKYLEQIIGVLTKAGFVKSVRGSSGGYRLARSPKEYTIGDILRLTEGSLAPVACVEEGVENCPKAETCVTLTVWQQLNDAINQVVNNITLADLVERSEEMSDFYSI